MARIDEAVADQVSEIISELPDIENWLIRAELVEAVRAMPPSVAARLIDKIEPWSRDATGFLCGDFAALISTFAAGGENVSAFRIAKALLEVTPDPAVDESGAGLVHAMPRTRPDLWNYEQILSTQVPELVKATGLEAMNLLGDLLSDAIRFSLRQPRSRLHATCPMFGAPQLRSTDRISRPRFGRCFPAPYAMPLQRSCNPGRQP